MLKFFNNPLVATLLTALFFGSWAVITRQAGSTMMQVAVGVLAGTFAPSVVYWAMSGAPNIVGRGLLWAFVAGLFNGVGFILWSKIASDKAFDLSTWQPIMFGGMIVFGVLSAMLFLGDKPSFDNKIGVALILAGIYMLRPS